jgi:hypothetical protein
MICDDINTLRVVVYDNSINGLVLQCEILPQIIPENRAIPKQLLSISEQC